ncbi:CG14854, partial [Drosophila busckii]
CLQLEYSVAKERYGYVLAKYAELEMKISGEPLGLHGKLVTHGDIEEQHIVFQLMDNTPHDVLQSCVFVVRTAPEECESIVTVCNTFLARTPRPLLERKPLMVCEDGVREAEAPVVPEAED